MYRIRLGELIILLEKHFNFPLLIHCSASAHAVYVAQPDIIDHDWIIWNTRTILSRFFFKKILCTVDILHDVLLYDLFSKLLIYAICSLWCILDYPCFCRLPDLCQCSVYWFGLVIWICLPASQNTSTAFAAVSTRRTWRGDIHSYVNKHARKHNGQDQGK